MICAMRIVKWKNGEEQSSGATYVKLLNSVGKFVLQKVDADHLLRTDKDGTRHYASLSGATIQVYDPEGKALFADGGKETNSLGRVVVEHVPFGVYTWEETEAPRGIKRSPDGIRLPSMAQPGSWRLKITGYPAASH